MSATFYDSFEKQKYQVISISGTTEMDKFYDDKWNLLGLESVLFKGNNENHYFYDANYKLTGELIIYHDGQNTTAQHYNSKLILTGTDITTVQGADTIVKHYDATYHLLNADITTVNGQATTVQHFDSNWKLTSADVTQASFSQSVIQHFDGSWNFTGADVKTFNLSTPGVGSTDTTYESHWQQIAYTSYASHDATGIPVTHTVSGITLHGVDNVNNSFAGFGGDDYLVGGSSTGYYQPPGFFTIPYTVMNSLSGNDGNDTLIGGNGQLDRFAAPSANYLSGGTGDDRLVGGQDAFNYLDGGTGHDTLVGGYLFYGGYVSPNTIGNDFKLDELDSGDHVIGVQGTYLNQLTTQTLDHSINLTSNTGNLFIDGAKLDIQHIDLFKYTTGSGNDSIDLSQAKFGADSDLSYVADYTIKIYSQGGNDTIVGEDSSSNYIKNYLDGGTGDDTLTGGSSHSAGGQLMNVLSGGVGHDVLIAGVGTNGGYVENHLLGGDDGVEDTFIFKPGAADSTIQDFHAGLGTDHDIIDLSAFHMTSQQINTLMAQIANGETQFTIDNQHYITVDIANGAPIVKGDFLFA